MKLSLKWINAVDVCEMRSFAYRPTRFVILSTLTMALTMTTIGYTEEKTWQMR